jgi:hypothetical protein
LRSGTVMHRSHLPFRYWFIAIHLLTSTKKKFFSQRVTATIGTQTLRTHMGIDA